MADYIEREALYELAYWHGEHPDISNPYGNGVDAVDTSDIDKIPAADVAPVVHGRWIPQSNNVGGEYTICSACRCRFRVAADGEIGLMDMRGVPYCPDCGAMMDGGTTDAAEVLCSIREAPTVDGVPVVRCKDCKYTAKAQWNKKGYRICPTSHMEITDDDFCSYGERRDT